MARYNDWDDTKAAVTEGWDNFKDSTKEALLGTDPSTPEADYSRIDPHVLQMSQAMDPAMRGILTHAGTARGREFAGDALMRGALDRAAQQQMGAAASTRGMSPVAAARLGGQMGNQMRMEAMPQIAALRAGEQQQQYKDILQALGMQAELQLGTQQAMLNPYTSIEAAKLGATMPGSQGFFGMLPGAAATGVGAYFGAKAGGGGGSNGGGK